MNLERLSRLFEAELKYKMAKAKKECKYNATRFNQMMARYGDVATAKQSIENSIRTGYTFDGYTMLFLCGCLDDNGRFCV